MTRHEQFKELREPLKKHCAYQSISYLYGLFLGISVAIFLLIAINNIINRSYPDLMFSMGSTFW